MKKLLAILLLLPNFAFAAIAIDSQGTNATQVGSPNSFTFINTAGTFLVVTASGSGDQQSATYNGVSMTRASSDTTHGGGAVFYLAAPATGSHTLTVNFLGNDNQVNATSLTGVAASPLGNTSTDSTATSTNPTFSFTTAAANSWVFDAQTLSTNSNGRADITTTGAGHLRLNAAQLNSYSVMQGFTIATSAAARTLGWTYPTATSYGGASAEIKASNTTNFNCFAYAEVSNDNPAIASSGNGNGNAGGVMFRPTQNCVIDSFTVGIQNTAGETATGKVYNDSGGVPGAVIDTCSTNTLSADGNQIFTCSGTVSLTAGSKYYVVLTGPGFPFAIGPRWIAVNPSTNSNTDAAMCNTNSGNAWNSCALDENVDMSVIGHSASAATVSTPSYSLVWW